MSNKQTNVFLAVKHKGLKIQNPGELSLKTEEKEDLVYLFNSWENTEYFYSDVNFVFCDSRRKKHYIPAVPVEIIEKFSNIKPYLIDIRCMYNNKYYSFLWSYQDTEKALNQVNVDYPSDEAGIPVVSDYNGYIACKIAHTLNVPQRIGMNYKYHYTPLSIYKEERLNGEFEVSLTKTWGHGVPTNKIFASLVNSRETAELINDKSEINFYITRCPARFPIPRGFSGIVIRETCDITDSYTDIIYDPFHKINNVTTSEWRIEKGQFGISFGTGTIESFYYTLSSYIGKNSYRVVASDFTITDGNFTISMKAGQRIWLCSEGESPNYAKAIRFVDDDVDYSGSVPDFITSSQNYYFWGNNNTGFAKVFKAKGRYGGYYDVSSYNVTINGNISFK